MTSRMVNQVSSHNSFKAILKIMNNLESSPANTDANTGKPHIPEIPRQANPDPQPPADAKSKVTNNAPHGTPNTPHGTPNVPHSTPQRATRQTVQSL